MKFISKETCLRFFTYALVFILYKKKGKREIYITTQIMNKKVDFPPQVSSCIIYFVHLIII